MWTFDQNLGGWVNEFGEFSVISNNTPDEQAAQSQQAIDLQASQAAADLAAQQAEQAKQQQMNSWLNQAQNYKPQSLYKPQPSRISQVMPGGLLGSFGNSGMNPQVMNSGGTNYGSGLLGMDQRIQQMQQMQNTGK